MRYAAVSGFHVARLPMGMKLLMTLYCVTVLVGLAVTVALVATRAGIGIESLATHYRGGSGIEDELLAPIGLDGQPLSPSQAMSTARLVEILHPHVFSVPIVLLVVCHLLALTRAPSAVKTGVALGAFGGFLLTFGGMGIATRTAAGVWVLVTGGSVLFASVACASVWPIFAAWAGRPDPD